jgi:hypothetical protein
VNRFSKKKIARLEIPQLFDPARPVTWLVLLFSYIMGIFTNMANKLRFCQKQILGVNSATCFPIYVEKIELFMFSVVETKNLETDVLNILREVANWKAQ